MTKKSSFVDDLQNLLKPKESGMLSEGEFKAQMRKYCLEKTISSITYTRIIACEKKPNILGFL